MYKNYFFLNRLTIEYASLCKGAVISEIFSQRKNELIFTLNGDDENFNLIFSVNQNDPFVLYRKNISRAKRNTAGFFNEYLPTEIIDITIAEEDRIIKISVNKGEFYFFLRGKDTNLLFHSMANGWSSFKRAEDDFIKSFSEETTKRNFTGHIFKPDLNKLPNSGNIFELAKYEYPYLGKDFLNEIKLRMPEDSAENFKSAAHEIIKEFEHDKCGLFYDKTNALFRLAPEFFKLPQEKIKVYDSFYEGLNSLFRERFRFEKESAAKKIISRFLDKELARTVDKLNETRAKLDSPSREDSYRNMGSLLLANKHVLHKGMKEIELDDYISGERVKVKLDEKLDPKDNINRYFDKAKNEKTLIAKMAELNESLSNKRSELLRKQDEFIKADDVGKLEKIMDDLNLNDERIPEEKKDIGIKFRHYLIDGKYNVFVGRDSRNNDLLTLKFAKQNDYWFHARSVPGSHVVLRVDNTKEVIPKNILQKAAQLAAFYSKAKTSKVAPVTYCLKKYVFKRKGMEAGQVALTKESVLLVAPEIPKDCEFVNE